MEDGRVVLREKQSFSNRPDKFRSHSKRVPNLLAGAPLLPGPITPNYVPLTSPELSRSNESFQVSVLFISSSILVSLFPGSLPSCWPPVS